MKISAFSAPPTCRRCRLHTSACSPAVQRRRATAPRALRVECRGRTCAARTAKRAALAPYATHAGCRRRTARAGGRARRTPRTSAASPTTRHASRGPCLRHVSAHALPPAWTRMAAKREKRPFAAAAVAEPPKIPAAPPHVLPTPMAAFLKEAAFVVLCASGARRCHGSCASPGAITARCAPSPRFGDPLRWRARVARSEPARTKARIQGSAHPVA